MLTSLGKLYGDIIILTVLPLALCFIFAILLRCFPEVFIGGLIFLFGFGSFGLTLFLWLTYFSFISDSSQENVSTENILSADPEVVKSIKSFADGNETQVSEVYNFNEEDSYYNTFIRKSRNNPKATLTFTLFVTLGSIFIVALIAAFRKSINLVVKIFKEATNATFCNPCIFTQPIFTLLFMVLVFIHYVFILVYIFSIRMPVIDERGFVSFDTNNHTSYVALVAIHTGFTLFLWEFALGCEQFIIAAAVARWYFERDKNICVLFPTWVPNKILIKYHLGTICCGALLLSITALIRKLLEYLQAKLKDVHPESCISTICCTSYCLAIVEAIFRFVNKNAYICSAIYGYNFVHSATRASSLLTTNFAFAALLNGLSWFFLLLGKVTVVTITAFVAFIYFRFKLGPDTPVTEYGVAVLVLSFIAYLIARCFFSVYDDVLNTLFICFCDDLERNDGEIRPYFASEQLQKIIQETTIKKNANPVEYTSSLKLRWK